MSDAGSDGEFYGQHVQLLPARTVLSTFALSGGGSNGGKGTDPVSNLLDGVGVVKLLSGPDSGGDSTGGVSGATGGSTRGL